MSLTSVDLTLTKELGAGAFGSVYKGVWKENVVAVKKISEMDFDPREVRILLFGSEIESLTSDENKIDNEPVVCVLVYVSMASVDVKSYFLHANGKQYTKGGEGEEGEGGEGDGEGRIWVPDS